MEPTKDGRSRFPFARSRSGAAALLALAAIIGCEGDGPSVPDPADPPLYGARITPRVSREADPLLADAYQSLTGDRLQIAHDAISWAEIATGPVLRDWKPLELHVQRARTSRVELSLVLEFLRGGEVEVPEYLEFIEWSWDEPTILWELARFLREMEPRTQGALRYLWLGEGPDRYIARHPELEADLIAFYSALADTARRIFPDATLGVLAVVSEIAPGEGSSPLRAIRDRLGALALSVYPAEAGETLPSPAEAVSLIEESIAPWTDAPLAIVETGYPSSFGGQSGESEQTAFASLFARWIHARPPALELVCWSPIHDAAPALAAELAARRYPDQEPERERHARVLSGHSLRRVDGSRKPARETFVEERP